jgi:BirA family biotin operon repressor/biotin-[acetyl-CoA-carboxylase] ligase
VLENQFQLERLRQGIKPFRLHWFPRLRSTNDHAAILRRRGELFAPAVVLTGHQFRGRGRGSNTWWSGEGSLTVTFVLPIDEALQPHQLPLIAGLAVRNAVARLCAEAPIQLKWPNDLLFEGRKLAGLLCERVHKADLVGLGLNVNTNRDTPAGLRRRIVSLEQIARRPLDKTEVLIAIVRQLHTVISRRSEHPFHATLREYDRHHALIGQRLTITNADDPPLTGVCQGLDSMGRLLLRTGAQLHRVIAGQVSVRGGG